ncbi:hypothetical protein Tco_0429027 [Tanacetum coccineum]
MEKRGHLPVELNTKISPESQVPLVRLYNHEVYLLMASAKLSHADGSISKSSPVSKHYYGGDTQPLVIQDIQYFPRTTKFRDESGLRIRINPTFQESSRVRCLIPVHSSFSSFGVLECWSAYRISIGSDFDLGAYGIKPIATSLIVLVHARKPRIMPPRRFKKKSVKRIVEKRVAKAIEEYEKTRADSNNTGGSGSANTGGTVAPDVHGCSYKTFTNGKPHTFNGTKGVVGLKCWFEKMEQVFEICKCAEDDKVKFVVCTFEGRALTWRNGNV